VNRHRTARDVVLVTFEPSCVDYSPSATIPSGSVVENLKSVLLRHNRAAARSTARVSQTAAGHHFCKSVRQR
jgi:hypothetical protein